MASPQEQGQIYLERFREWIKSMSDDDFRQIVYSPKGILNRQQIKKLAGLSDQAIKKNENVYRKILKISSKFPLHFFNTFFGGFFSKVRVRP